MEVANWILMDGGVSLALNYHPAFIPRYYIMYDIINLINKLIICE